MLMLNFSRYIRFIRFTHIFVYSINIITSHDVDVFVFYLKQIENSSDELGSITTFTKEEKIICYIIDKLQRCILSLKLIVQF